MRCFKLRNQVQGEKKQGKKATGGTSRVFCRLLASGTFLANVPKRELLKHPKPQSSSLSQIVAHGFEPRIPHKSQEVGEDIRHAGTLDEPGRIC